MSYRGAPIIPWRNDRYAQDEFARPENSTALGKFLAVAFLGLGLVGLYVLVQVTQDVQRNNDIELTGWSEELDVANGRCIYAATGVLSNDGDADLEITSTELIVYTGFFFDREDATVNGPVSLPQGETVTIDFEIDLGTSCPRDELFDNGSPHVFWTHPADPTTEQDRSLPTP